jgi:outer membrane protein assembly factor BamB
VYCGESTGTVRCLNAATGALVWAKTPSAACIPDALAVNNATGRLYAITSGTTRLYTFLTSNGNYMILPPLSAWTGAGSAIAIDSVSTDLIIGESNGRLRRLRLSDLCEEWIQSNSGSVLSLQVGHDGYAYAAFYGYGNARKILLSTGAAVWNYSNTADTTDIYGITADVSGNVYATWAKTVGSTSTNNLVRRLSPVDGSVVDTWQPYALACFRGIACTPGHKAAGY